MKKFLISLFFITLSVLSTPVFVSSIDNTQAEIDALNKQVAEKKKKIAEIEKSIEAYKSKITQTQAQTISLTNQMSILDNRISQVNLDVEATTDKLETLKLELESLRLSITQINTNIERQKKILSELIRELHHEDDKNMIEILSAYDNVSDFYQRVNRVETLQYHVGKSAETLRLARIDLVKKEAATEDNKKSYEQVNVELSEKKQELQVQVESKQTLLTQTKASEQTYKTLVSNLKSQHQAVENDISSIETQVRKKLAEKQKTQPEKFDVDSGELSWPVSSRRVTAYFWDPTYPYRQVFEHNAIDIAAPQGSPVKAAASGYVAKAKRCTTSSCYAYVMIIHSNGVSTVYGHLSSVGVTEEQYVTRGDLIGYSGAKPGTVGAGPFTTGAHLHFEVRKNGIPTNPLSYLKK